MNTLQEIINICKSGEKPDIDDARMAICALDALIILESTHLMWLVQREKTEKVLVFTPLKKITTNISNV